MQKQFKVYLDKNESSEQERKKTNIIKLFSQFCKKYTFGHISSVLFPVLWRQIAVIAPGGTWKINIRVGKSDVSGSEYFKK